MSFSATCKAALFSAACGFAEVVRCYRAASFKGSQTRRMILKKALNCYFSIKLDRLGFVLTHPFRDEKTQILRLRSDAEWMGNPAFLVANRRPGLGQVLGQFAVTVMLPGTMGAAA
jgi:hypothetical protein